MGLSNLPPGVTDSMIDQHTHGPELTDKGERFIELVQQVSDDPAQLPIDARKELLGTVIHILESATWWDGPESPIHATVGYLDRMLKGEVPSINCGPDDSVQPISQEVD